MVKEALSFTLNNCCFTMWYLDKLQANHWNCALRHFSLILAFYVLMKESGCSIFRNLNSLMKESFARLFY